MLILKKTKQNCTLATLVISKKKKKVEALGSSYIVIALSQLAIATQTI
jgi:hypothetical protein